MLVEVDPEAGDEDEGDPSAAALTCGLIVTVRGKGSFVVEQPPTDAPEKAGGTAD
ncbi:hypothetical protein [Streptomyces sp. NPDC000931]|uniref:hypothetical protein n=1 Tax=Streptomyces sp. NPDC000931 TaxID=3154372 RepID=UPI0033170072